MEFKKPYLTEISVEDLLLALDNNIEVENVYSSDVLNFISFYKIEPGDNLISGELLYKLYKTYTLNPTTVKKFIIELTYHLKYSSVSNKVYFRINKKSLDISDKIIKHLANKKEDVTKNKDYKIHFEAYLKFYDIKPGRFWITGHALHYLYDKWAYNNKSKKYMGIKELMSYLKLFFEYKNSKGKHLTYFRVHKENILKHISKEKMKTLEIARKKTINVQRKNKKREDKIPEPAPGT